MSHAPHTASRDGIAFLGRHDRSRALARARRRTAVVRVLRVALPVAALGVASLYVLPSLLTVAVPGGGQASVERVDIAAGGLKMVNPRIKGVSERGAYDVRADDAVQQVSTPELITLNRINAELTTKDGAKTVLVAPGGLFHSKAEELTFSDGVAIDGTAGLVARLRTAKAFLKDKRIVSDDPVDLRFHASTIRASGMTIFVDEARAVFTGRVAVHIERQPAVRATP